MKCKTMKVNYKLRIQMSSFEVLPTRNFQFFTIGKAYYLPWDNMINIYFAFFFFQYVVFLFFFNIKDILSMASIEVGHPQNFQDPVYLHKTTPTMTLHRSFAKMQKSNNSYDFD
uniref:Uncharacterized protein n=1 Tax=Rhizophora mucronata TaxID=61149 RepID=A0A2P2IIT7_RHIMU